MGNALNLAIIVLSIQMVLLLTIFGIRDVNPDSPYLLSNRLQLSSSALYGSMDTTNDTWAYTYDSDSINSLNEGDNAFLSITGSIVPDWIKAFFSWITTAGAVFIDMIGAPYTILMYSGIDSSLSAVLGTFFAIIGLAIIVNWITGKDT